MSILPYRPLIGIPAGSYDSSHPGVKTFRFNGNYTAALAQAGALPVAIPLNLDQEALAALFERLDGLCLAGGDDMDPAHYGEAPHPALHTVDAPRDGVELTLARWALARDLPLLGICRGIQALNVAAGGNLYQDLATEYPGAACHDYSYRSSESPWEQPIHSIRLAPAGELARILGTTELRTNSFHHQAVKELAPGFEAVAWAEDGVIEGIAAPGRRFMLGVQWHPEAMTAADAASRRLFEAFVAAAAQGARSSTAGL